MPVRVSSSPIGPSPSTQPAPASPSSKGGDPSPTGPSDGFERPSKFEAAVGNGNPGGKGGGPASGIDFHDSGKSSFEIPDDLLA